MDPPKRRGESTFDLQEGSTGSLPEDQACTGGTLPGRQSPEGSAFPILNHARSDVSFEKGGRYA